MRIAHVTDSFLPRLGGIENHVDDLAHRQLSNGHDVHVITATAGPSTAESDSGPTVHRLGSHWLGTARRAAFGAGREERLLTRGRYDVVHVHASVISPLAAAFAAAATDCGIPTAVTVHSMWPENRLLLAATGAGLRLAQRPIAWSAVSQVAATPIRRALGGALPVAVLPNAVDTAWWQAGQCAEPSPPNHGAGEVVVTSVMRLAPRKRPLPLLRMMERVHDRVSGEVPIRLVIAGDGPQRAAIERHVQRRGMDGWVDLPGRLRRTAIRDLLASSSLYVAPANLESFGIAALEARVVGLPIVAKTRGGVGEFVRPGIEGLLAGSDREMADAIAHLAVGTTLRTRIREHNQRVLPSVDWPDALARTERLYARAAVLSGTRSGAHQHARALAGADSEAPA